MQIKQRSWRRLTMVTASLKTYQSVIQRGALYLDKYHIKSYLAERLIMDRMNWNRTDLVLNLNKQISDSVYLQYLKDLNELIDGKPLQYIVGKEWFYGLPLKVTSDTLIPRPETEELVHEALKHLKGKEKLDVLDVGTGSGAIAIALKANRPDDKVTATDISKEALQVAAENASSHGLDIRFLEGDLLEPVSLETFDCILSNPPYVGRQEEHLMDESVLKYEPHSALFADHEGLCIYERLAYELPFYLKTDGCLFMEIGFQQGDQLLALYKRAFPDKEVSIQKDINGLDRMLIVI